MNGVGNCGQFTNAWTLPGVLIFDNLITISLCDPRWFNESSLEQATIIVHEGSHLALSTADLAYEWDPGYYNLIQFNRC
jgi:hypothetical protein